MNNISVGDVLQMPSIGSGLFEVVAKAHDGYVHIKELANFGSFAKQTKMSLWVHPRQFSEIIVKRYGKRIRFLGIPLWIRKH